MIPVHKRLLEVHHLENQREIAGGFRSPSNLAVLHGGEQCELCTLAVVKLRLAAKRAATSGISNFQIYW